MKLNTALSQSAIDQLGVSPLPEQHPAMPQLNQVFGEHTFFLDPNGLHIIEPRDPNQEGAPTGEVVKVAGWSDAERTALAPHQPEPTGVVVVFVGAGPDSAA